MTLIVKVYDSHQKAQYAMKNLCEFNQPYEIKNYDMKVKLLTGDTILFVAVRDINDAIRLSGYQVQWMELDSCSTFDIEVMQWLKSRIRTPPSMIKE